MLAFPQTPHALVVRKLRRSPAAHGQARPQRDVGDVAQVLVVVAVVVAAALRRRRSGSRRCRPRSATMPSLTRNPAARSMSSPGVRMVRRERLAADPDAERLLGRQQVGALGRPARRASAARSAVPAAAPSCRSCRAPPCRRTVPRLALPQATSDLDRTRGAPSSADLRGLVLELAGLPAADRAGRAGPRRRPSGRRTPSTPRRARRRPTGSSPRSARTAPWAAASACTCRRSTGRDTRHPDRG